MTTRVRFAVIALGLLLSAAGPGVAQAKLRVVATLSDLWVLTQAVGGDLVTADLVTRLGQNPHDMEIRPSQILIVKRADVLVRNSLEYDMWIDPMVESAGNPKVLRGSPNVIEAGRGIQVLKVPPVADRSLGDIHPLGNPHYYLDPANAVIVTANIVAGLSRVAPEQAPRFEANRKAFLDRLATAERRWKETLAPYRGAKVVSYHDTFPYFYRAFGLVEGGILEDRPGIPPSPQHVANLIRQMKEEKVKVILLETWYPAQVASFVARETGATVVSVPALPGAVKGTEDYVSFIDYLVETVAKALA
jgi:zinc/manganese transport system substrate-binding protein